MKFLDLTGLQYFYEKYLRPLKNAAFKDVANDLTTSIDGFVLDARQGTVLDEKKLDKSKVINNALTTEEGFALDARQGKVLKDEIDELNGKMKADDDWRTYSDNGWEMQYRHISQNQVYVEVKKTSTGNNAAIVGDLVMAGVPFAASFGQIVPVYMDVSGSIVGYGRANFATNNGLYLYTPAYGNSVSYTVFGIVTVE